MVRSDRHFHKYLQNDVAVMLTDVRDAEVEGAQGAIAGMRAGCATAGNRKGTEHGRLEAENCIHDRSFVFRSTGACRIAHGTYLKVKAQTPAVGPTGETAMSSEWKTITRSVFITIALVICAAVISTNAQTIQVPPRPPIAYTADLWGTLVLSAREAARATPGALSRSSEVLSSHRLAARKDHGTRSQPGRPTPRGLPT